MIDPLISLAFSLHTNRGAYALLLGSGVSRAAGIPTGWEVVTSLIERVAALQGEETGGEPATWFHERYGGEPRYSALLEELAAEPAESRRRRSGSRASRSRLELIARSRALSKAATCA